MRFLRPALAGFCAVSFIGNCLEAASGATLTMPSPTLSVQPVSNSPAYDSIAVYDPVTAKAKLYSAERLVPQTSPELSWTEGVTPATVSVPTSPGVYEAVWNDGASVAPLIVSSNPSVRHSRVVVIVPDYTLQAYSDTGGGSFYINPIEERTDRKVSLERPYRFVRTGQTPPANFISPLAQYAATIDFLTECSGSVDVVAQSLLDTLPYNLSAYSVVVLMGHDEYWTPSLRSKLETAVSNGTSLLNMSGNTGYRKLIRSGSVLGMEPQGSIWGNNPADTTVSELTGVKYMRYPLAVELARLRSPVRSALITRYRRNGFPRWVAKRRFLKYTSGIHTRTGANPLFDGSTLTAGRFFGVASRVLDVEVDGLPLTARGASKGSWASANDVTRTTVSGDAWVDNRGDRVGVIVQHLFGRGRVVTLGSVGWITALYKGDADVQHVTRNAVNLLLAPMGPALASTQWQTSTRMTGGTSFIALLGLQRGVATSVSVDCTRVEDPSVSVWCAASVLSDGTVRLRVPSHASVNVFASISAVPTGNYILAYSPTYVTKSIVVAGG